jgi:hypothetical protein
MSARTILKRIGLTLLSVVLLVVVLGVLAYEFGSMETPTPEVRAQYAALVASGAAPPAPATGFHIPIPGCRCHGTDPVQQVQHAGYTIRQCSACHRRGGPSQASAASAPRS